MHKSWLQCSAALVAGSLALSPRNSCKLLVDYLYELPQSLEDEVGTVSTEREERAHQGILGKGVPQSLADTADRRAYSVYG